MIARIIIIARLSVAMPFYVISGASFIIAETLSGRGMDLLWERDGITELRLWGARGGKDQ